MLGRGGILVTDGPVWAEWARPAAGLLFGPVAAELESMPEWAAAEPEWVRLGLVRAEPLRRARRACIVGHGIHAYVHLVRASITDPEGAAELLAGSADPAVRRAVFREETALMGAAHLQQTRNLSDLALFLDYLSRLEGPGPEDLYDLIGLWGGVDARIAMLLDICQRPDPRMVETALLALSAQGLRGFVTPRLTELIRIVEDHEHPALMEVLRRAFG